MSQPFVDSVLNTNIMSQNHLEIKFFAIENKYMLWLPKFVPKVLVARRDTQGSIIHLHSIPFINIPGGYEMQYRQFIVM